MRTIYQFGLAAAALALCNPAQAAVTVNAPDTGPDGSFSIGFSSANVARPSFSETFSFTTTLNGLLSAIISTTGGGPRSRNDVDFTRVFISGTGLGAGVDLTSFFNNDVSEIRTLDDFALSAGTYNFTTTGTANGNNGSYGGTITFEAAAVPEPTTWALMLAGFGMIGFGLRRRSNVKTTVSYI